MSRPNQTSSPTPDTGWRKPAGQVSLAEVHRSILVPATASFWRKLLAFSGPGFLIAVGYMDPGNWATDLAGGAQFGYTLLSVVMVSNLMAILLQHLSIKLGRRHRTRSGPGLPRSLFDADRLVSLDALRNRHRRLRPGRSRRFGHRAATALRHSAGLGLRHHGARTCSPCCFCRAKVSVTSRRWSSR